MWLDVAGEIRGEAVSTRSDRGSGYGKTPMLFFKKQPSGDWLATELRSVDLGSP